MNLFQALNTTIPLRTAMVGAGGKTTTAFQLARQVDGFAWVTTTAHMGTDQTHFADRHFVLESEADFTEKLFCQQKVTLLTGPYTRDDRLKSPDDRLLERMHEAADRENASILIEADGSRSIPLKAPGEDEPPIPAWVTSVIVLVGLSGLGKPLSNGTVFRAERFAELSGLKMGEEITIEGVSRMLIHSLGGLKNIPAGTLKVVLFNQADQKALHEKAQNVAPFLLTGGFDRVIIGGLKSAPDGFTSYSR